MATVTHRKLIRFGKGIAITLPKAWTDYYALTPGDTVLVKINSKLVVSLITNKKDFEEKMKTCPST